jgi:predicted PurR-regulated permease PerM
MQPTFSSSPYGTATRWVLVAVAVGIVLAALWYVRGILMLTLASIILVTLFTMPARLFIRWGLQRNVAIIMSLVLIVGVIMLLFAVSVNSLVDQFTTLATETVPAGIRELTQRWEEGTIQQQFPFLQQIDVAQAITSASDQITTAIGQLGASVLPVIGGVASTLLSFLIIVFMSLYFLADPKAHQEGFIRLFPIWYRDRMRHIFGRLDETLRGWLRATLASMLFVGVATGILLALMGIEQAAALGVIAGLLSFVPNFGPIIALIPSIAAAVVQTPDNVLWIVLIIYGVSFVQSQIVAPMLVADSINLPAVLILLGQIVAGAFLGFLGIMLAVPITAIIMVMVQEIYIKDVLGDKPLVIEGSVRPEALVEGGQGAALRVKGGGG